MTTRKTLEQMAQEATMERMAEDDDIQVYQRPWVGLTDENMETLILKHAPPLHSDYEDDSLHGLLQAANDFLKELNT